MLPPDSQLTPYPVLENDSLCPYDASTVGSLLNEVIIHGTHMNMTF